MRKIKNILWGSLFFLCLPTHAANQGEDDVEELMRSRPNILIVLADDLGYRDLNCYGGAARTPNLDALASEGLRFTNCYAAAPNCSPSRVGLLSGRIPTRAGMYSYRAQGSVMHLPDSEITIAELLKPVGYQTAHFGKWHLGVIPQNAELNQPQPSQQGFDYSFGTENNAEPSHLNPVNFVRNGLALGELKGYSCQLVADEINVWFENHYEQERPFFLYVAFHEPHTKIASPDAMKASYARYGDKLAAYYANIENMDVAMGRIRETIRSKGLEKNTMIFFASDNGPYRMGSQGELRGLKSELYDGGIKVPGIFSYRGVFPGNRDIEIPIWFQDLLPTIAELCGAEVPKDRPYDGISLLPLLKGGTMQREEPMLWFFYRSAPEVAMRKGDYTLLARTDDTIPRTHWISDIDMPFIKDIQLRHFELYNVIKDVSQQNDIAAVETERLERMKEDLFILLKEITNEGPSWEGLPKYDAMKANYIKQKK